MQTLEHRVGILEKRVDNHGGYNSWLKNVSNL